MVRHIVLLVVLGLSWAQAEENPFLPTTELTKITQLSQLKAMFVKAEPKTESFDETLAHIKASALAFAEKHSDKNADKKWNKKFKNRIETRAKDSQISDNDAADELVMDWLVPRRNQTSWDDYEAMEICHMFLYYGNRSWSLPDKVQEYLKSEGGRMIEGILAQ